MKSKVCGIYKITSPTGKIYIGQSKDIYHRFNSYHKLRCVKQPRIYRSLKKHTPEKHKYEIVSECLISELDKMEEYYISLFDSCNSNFGLNVRSGGLSTTMSDELKERLSNIQKERFKNNRAVYDTTVKNLALIKRSGKDNPIYGTGKSFVKFDLKLNFISEYKSLFDLLSENKIGKIYVYRCCNRKPKYQTAGGFIWRFKDDCIVENGKLKENIIFLANKYKSKAL